MHRGLNTRRNNGRKLLDHVDHGCHGCIAGLLFKHRRLEFVQSNRLLQLWLSHWYRQRLGRRLMHRLRHSLLRGLLQQRIEVGLQCHLRPNGDIDRAIHQATCATSCWASRCLSRVR
ncbi:hypothetical protein D3C76_552860 [compost metagenome]